MIIMLCFQLLSTLGYPGKSVAGNRDLYPYQDPNIPVNERVRDLVSRMTLDEKISQLGNITPAIDRFGIQAYQYWNEALHGVVATGVTSFPQAIALSSTWDDDLIFRIASAISDEARVLNRRNGKGLTYWSPTINMSRDPRWGRAEETYGEDPFLAARLAQNFIRGMQGNDPKYLKTVSTVKHFACNNVDSGRHRISSNVDERSLREYYLPAFKACVQNAHVYSVMNTYNALNDVPGPVNRTLLRYILRDEWGFEGYVVSDCDAVADVHANHHYVLFPQDATALSVRSGTDLNCGATYQIFSKIALSEGLMSVADVDSALSRVLKARFLLGEFDPPGMVPYMAIPDSAVDCLQHRNLALRAAREAIVLLKNQDAILPVNRDSVSSIAVIGPNADVVQLGGYSGTPAVSVTPLQGIIGKFSGAGRNVYYSQGCSLYGPVDSAAFNNAVTLAKNCDVAIVVCGTDLQAAKEEVDRNSLDLPAVQDSLIQKVFRANPKTIVVMVTGFPLSVNRMKEHIPGIVVAWYDGQAQGSAIADVLFGDFNPGGKLTSTWYKSVSDLPEMDHYNIREGRTYLYFNGVPLYPFGHGLSYTTFAYSDLVKSGGTLNQGDSVTVSVAVKNTGSVAGAEVVQLYVRHVAPAIVRPLKELRGFQRISLLPAEQKRVVFRIKHEDLAYYDEKTKCFMVDDGVMDILVGSSSEDIRLTDTVRIRGSLVSKSYRRNAFLRIEAEEFEKKSKPVKIVACSEGGQSIEVAAENDYLEYRNVDFGDGVTHFDARIQCLKNAGMQGLLEIRPDSLTAQASGWMILDAAATDSGYQLKSAAMTGLTGVHDVFLVFKNSGNGFCKMNWFGFHKDLQVPGQDNDDVQIYPNPASAYFWLMFTGTGSTEVKVEIYSLEGILKKSYRLDSNQAGVNKLIFNTGEAGLAQGVYIVKSTVNNRTVTKKLCIVR